MAQRKLGLWISATVGPATLLVYSCTRLPPARTPQRAAREFLQALKAHNCDKAWQHLSSESQRAIVAKSDEFKTSPGFSKIPQEYLDPKALICQPSVLPAFHGYDADTVQPGTVEGNTAVVGVKQGFADGFLIPGFWPTKTRYEDKQLSLVQEAGEWKIVYRP